MSDVTRAETCVIACAEIFSGAGEIMASPMATTPLIGARLARLTTEPGGEAGPAGDRHRDTNIRKDLRASTRPCLDDPFVLKRRNCRAHRMTVDAETLGQCHFPGQLARLAEFAGADGDTNIVRNLPP